MRQQRDHREQRQHCRGRARDGLVRPLPLRLHAEMSTCLLERHFNLPSSDEVLKHLAGITFKVGREQGLRLELLRRVSDQHPSDGNRRLSRVIPHRHSRRDFNRSRRAAIPPANRVPSPWRLCLLERRRKRRQPHPLQPGSPILSRLAWWRRLIKRGIEAQARNHGHLPTQCRKQFEGGKTAVSHHDHLALGQPSLDLQEHLPRPFSQLLRRTPAIFVVALGRAQASQHRQRPDSLRPGDAHRQHQGQPTQTARLDEVGVRRTHRVAVDPFSGDAFSAPPLDSVIDGKDQCARRRELLDEQREQPAARGARRPAGAVQDAMISLEVPLVAQTADAQRRGYSALTRCQDGTDEQDLHVLPDRLGKQWGERYNQARQFGRQCEHRKTSLGGVGQSAYAAFRFIFKDQEWIKSSLGAVLLDNGLAAIVTSELSTEDFYLMIHRNAFAAMKAMHERDATKEIDPILLVEAMRSNGSYFEGVAAQISNFSYGLPSVSASTLIKRYISTLKQQTALRQLLTVCARTGDRIQRADESPEKVFAEISAQLETIKQHAKFGGSALRVACMADVAPETVTWLWFPFIPKGKLTIIEGDGGIGKSWLTCAIASALSYGRGLPTSDPFEAGSALFLSAEDGLADTLRPRLDEIGADVSRIYALAEPLTLDATGLLRLESAVIEYAPALIVIDPLFAFTGGKVDIHRANEARSITAPLAAIAERHGCAIVAVRHLNKSRGGGNVGNAGMGSVDFYAAARSVLLVGKDPDDQSKRALCQIKNNLAALGEPQGYTIEGGKFYWTGASDLTAGRILSFASDDDERNAQAEAVEFLRAALEDGARPAKIVKAEAAQAGLTEQNLRTARTRLGIKPFKEGGGFGGKGAKWMWRLPNMQDVKNSECSAQDVKENGEQHLVVNDADNNICSNGLLQDVASDFTNGLCNVSQHLEAAERD